MKLQNKTIEKLRVLINEETEYRSGPQLVSLFNHYGFHDIYGSKFPSRWVYTEDRLNRLNGTSKIEEIIADVLSPVNFIDKESALRGIVENFNKYLIFDGFKVSIQGKVVKLNKVSEQVAHQNNEDDITDEQSFLNQRFSNVLTSKLGLDSQLERVLSQRLGEIPKCLKSGTPLAAIFLCGSTLEGILLSTATQHTEQFMKSISAPKSKQGTILQLTDWKLSALIDVAYTEKFLSLDVKKFSHELRDFRNYIHPYQQMVGSFFPTEHTARICWQVLQAAISQLSK